MLIYTSDYIKYSSTYISDSILAIHKQVRAAIRTASRTRVAYFNRIESMLKRH